MSVEAVSLILPVQNRAGEIANAVRAWHSYLSTTSREFEILVVDQGSTDETPTIVEGLTTELKAIQLHRSGIGFGVALGEGLGHAKYPLIAYSALDYPYTPADLGKMLERIAETDPHLNRHIDLVSGCRTGGVSPFFWLATGVVYRSFCRVILGMPLQAPLGWLGFGEHLRSWIAWAVFGDPLTDPNSAFKLIRRSVLDKFPIQSDGDFVHVELVGKATFTTCLMDELPLTAQTAAIPATSWSDFWKVLKSPEFHVPMPATDTPVTAEAD
jgi:glycosyltransferase involved in cell wall biosynthesis